MLYGLRNQKNLPFRRFLDTFISLFYCSAQEKIFSRKFKKGKIFINTAARMFHNTIATERSRDENE